MNVTNKSIIARNVPLRLNTEQMESPVDVLTTHFRSMSLDETRDVLWEAFSRALCGQQEVEDNLSARDLLYFHSQFEALIEASFLIQAGVGNTVNALSTQATLL